MVFDEGRDEVIAVVVAGMAAQGERLPGLGAGLLEDLGQQLLDQEFVAQALVDQDAAGERRAGVRCHQGAGVILLPRVFVGAEVAAEGLLAPRATAWRGDRREGRDRAEQVGVPERHGQRAMAAHRVAEDAHPARVGLEGGQHQRMQFQQIAVHAVVARPRFLGGVEVEAGAGAEVPAVAFSRHVGAARAGVGRDQDDAQFAGQALGAGLDHEGFFGAGQAGQVEQDRQLLLARRRRQVDREFHRQSDGGRVVLVEALHAAEAGVFIQELGHLGVDCS